MSGCYRYLSLSNGAFISNSFTCSTDTCCFVALCKDTLGCEALTYSVNFVGTLNAGAIAGIVVGCVFILVLCAAALRARTRASAPAVYEPIMGAAAPLPQQRYSFPAPQQQQYPGAYPAAPQGYQQPYAQPAYPQPHAHQQPFPQQSYQQQGYQTAPLTAPPPPPPPQIKFMTAYSS